MKKFLSLVLALVMTMSLVTVSAGAQDFGDSDDISSDAYAEAIDVMSALEIIDGYSNGDFQPQGTLTRGAAAKIIACMMLGKTTAESLGTQAAPFKDVPVGSTFAGYIAYCVEAGLIDGYADGTFRPQNTLTGFAFLKMLLTALGYDSAVEGFTGSNWTVNVARRAIENGLTDGNDNFVGTRAATREEACLYAANTIKATLVEYENKGSSITINGVEIVQGASSPKVVTSVNFDQSTSIDATPYTTGATGQQVTYTVEFGESYMPRLSLKGTRDDFMRPAHVWDYKGVEIGTYTDEADLTYTTKVTSNDIYDDLGLTGSVVADVYEDGVQIADFTVKNNDINTKIGANGVLTQVFKDGHWDGKGKWITDVTITKVNTYVGDVVSKTAATSVRDAYITVAARGDKYVGGNYTTDDFAMDDIVIYNYSKKPGSVGVKNVAAAETVTGTLTSYTTGDSATVGGKEYDYSYKIAREATQAAVNTDVTAVLDSYGYIIDIEGSDAVYAVVLKAVNVGLRPEATLLFTDGTTKDVVLSAGYSAGDETIASYTMKSNDRYELTNVTDKIVKGTDNDAVTITNGQYQFTLDGKTYSANGKTIFLVKTADANGNAMYAAYEGIKNVPTITKGDNGDTVAVFCKNNDLATVVYVDASDRNTVTVLDPTSDVVFIKGNNNDDSYTTGIGSYHRYVAVVNGELREGSDQLMVNTSNDVNGGSYALFDGVWYDANGVATLSMNNIYEGEGVYKQENEVLGTYDVTKYNGAASGDGFNYNGSSDFRYWPAADDCYVVMVDVDGNITTGYTIASVVLDTNDKIWFKVNGSGEVASAYIVKVEGGESLSNDARISNILVKGQAVTASADPKADYEVTLTYTQGNSSAQVLSFTKDSAATVDVRASTNGSTGWNDWNTTYGSNDALSATTRYARIVVTAANGTATTTTVVKITVAAATAPTLAPKDGMTGVNPITNPTPGISGTPGTVPLTAKATVGDLKAALTATNITGSIVVEKAGALGGWTTAADTDEINSTTASSFRITAVSSDDGKTYTWNITSTAAAS